MLVRWLISNFNELHVTQILQRYPWTGGTFLFTFKYILKFLSAFLLLSCEILVLASEYWVTEPNAFAAIERSQAMGCPAHV